MNPAAVQDFLKKIFSTAFGCPRRASKNHLVLFDFEVLMNHSILGEALRRGALVFCRIRSKRYYHSHDSRTQRKI